MILRGIALAALVLGIRGDGSKAHSGPSISAFAWHDMDLDAGRWVTCVANGLTAWLWHEQTSMACIHWNARRPIPLDVAEALD